MLPVHYTENRFVHLPKINIQVIPHSEQRYETIGDYWDDSDGTKQIRVSASTPHYEFLIAVHELVESYLVASKGINISDIDKFDQEFEKMRNEYPKFIGDMEPGDNDNAPYYHEHQIASRIEKWLADTLGVDWNMYEKTLNKMKK